VIGDVAFVETPAARNHEQRRHDCTLLACELKRPLAAPPVMTDAEVRLRLVALELFDASPGAPPRIEGDRDRLSCPVVDEIGPTRRSTLRIEASARARRLGAVYLGERTLIPRRSPACRSL